MWKFLDWWRKFDKRLFFHNIHSNFAFSYTVRGFALPLTLSFQICRMIVTDIRLCSSDFVVSTPLIVIGLSVRRKESSVAYIRVRPSVGPSVHRSVRRSVGPSVCRSRVFLSWNSVRNALKTSCNWLSSIHSFIHSFIPFTHSFPSLIHSLHSFTHSLIHSCIQRHRCLARTCFSYYK